VASSTPISDMAYFFEPWEAWVAGLPRCIMPAGLGSAAAHYSETSLEFGSKVRRQRLPRMDCGPSAAYPSIRMGRIWRCVSH
jgi:hypothetical protein